MQVQRRHQVVGVGHFEDNPLYYYGDRMSKQTHGSESSGRLPISSILNPTADEDNKWLSTEEDSRSQQQAAVVGQGGSSMEQFRFIGPSSSSSLSTTSALLSPSLYMTSRPTLPPVHPDPTISTTNSSSYQQQQQQQLLLQQRDQTVPTASLLDYRRGSSSSSGPAPSETPGWPSRSAQGVSLETLLSDRKPRPPRPSYSEEQKFFIMYARIIRDNTWPEIEDRFEKLFAQRSKGGLTSVYYRVRREWGLMEVLKSEPGSYAADCREVEQRAMNFSREFLAQIGYISGGT